VAPGFIDTELLQSMPQKKLAEYVEGIPLRRLGRPEEVAELIAYLASDDAGYVTGQTLRIDGGLVMS
jgi:3-oxoacyl-[acyl-carrier protein] reductase